MPTVTPTTKVEVKLGASWVDVTADTRSAVQSIRIQYGITGTGPNDRIASTGTCQYALNNSSSNSTGNAGAYSPGHTNARANWDIGVLCRISLAFDGTTYWKHFGTITAIAPDAGQYQRRAVMVTSVDWIDEAATAKVRGIPIATGQRADQLIATLVTTAVTRQPQQTDYDAGISTFAFAFDNLKDTQTTVIKALKDVVMSELGFLYVRGSTVSPGGELHFESRHARPKISPDTATHFDETMVALNISRSRSDVINTIYIVVHPRTVSASSTNVLWELTTTEVQPSIPAGTTVDITAMFTEASINAYRVGGQSLQAPSAGTDWIANTASDGSGSVITSDVAMTIVADQIAANAAVLRFVNSGTVTAYLTTIQLRGQTVKDVSETVVSSTNVTSKTNFGSLDRRLDMKYESDVTLSSLASEWLVNLYSDARYVVKGLKIIGSTSALLTQVLAREPGDMISVTETVTGLDESLFFINGVQLTVDPSGLTSADWVLAPAEQQASWILDTSLLGIGTVLGFA